MTGPRDYARFPASAREGRMRVLGLSGSLRRGSYNRKLLHAARQMLPNDVEFTIWSGLDQIPPYNEDVDGERPPLAVRHLRDDLGRADALLVATPEYNSSVPGVLKNAIDWASRPFPNNALARRPTAVIGASTGLFGAVWAQAEIRKALGTAGASVVDRDLPVASAAEAFRPDGGLRDHALNARLIEIVDELLERATGVAEGASEQAGVDAGAPVATGSGTGEG